MSAKAVLLVGGAQKGTRFRPLSLGLPKPLFPVAGLPLIEHHIEQLCECKALTEILLLGFYPSEEFTHFIECAKKKYGIHIEYLEENAPSGTAGGLLRFRDRILQPTKGKETEYVFVLNADICGDLPITDLLDEIKRQPDAEAVLLTTEATRDQASNFGCLVVDPKSKKVLHYVEKPSTFVSITISCGIFILRPNFWPNQLERAEAEAGGNGTLWYETDVFPQMASDGKLYALHTTRWWSQTKTPAGALYANGHYLRLYRVKCPERLAKSSPQIIGDVFIDPTAVVDPTAKIGPNVSIGAGAVIGAGVRVRESIILPECVLEEHCCVLHAVVGWRSILEPWTRVEGTPIAPNPNVPFAKLDNKPLFNGDGRLNPSLTILGSNVRVLRELVILNTVVLPYKELSTSKHNQIIL
uniref:NTP_transferase domain-containing protein n=2 Tax=Bursaphelenchus xylophilus TaxID=6326 RepID=A0A1I7SBW9_BURXY